MAFCDKLEEYLKKEGFCPEKTDFGLQFKYETLDFIHFRDDQDENFLNLFFPQIFEVTEENRADVYAALNKANADVRWPKAQCVSKMPFGPVWKCSSPTTSNSVTWCLVRST